MKLLYFGGLYCPSFGGAELSIHELLKRLSSQNIEILVVTDMKYTSDVSRVTILKCVHFTVLEYATRSFTLRSLYKTYMKTQAINRTTVKKPSVLTGSDVMQSPPPFAFCKHQVSL